MVNMRISLMSVFAFAFFVILAISAGCLFKPFSGEFETSIGCAYSNPACTSIESCINNSCIKKTGCDYSNPVCASNESCVNNACITLAGCTYGNPSCGADYECQNNSCVEKTICGKFGCQVGESDSNCCQDCGCPLNSSCSPGGVCVSTGADLIFEDYKSQELPASFLYSVPRGTLETEAGPIVQVTIKNTGSQKAGNVKLKAEVQGFTGTTLYEFGSINPGNSIQFNYTPSFGKKALNITNKTSANVLLALEYLGGNMTQTKSLRKELIILPIDSFDWRVPQAASAWVDYQNPEFLGFGADATDHANIIDDIEKERAARQVLGHLQALDIQYKKKIDALPSACYSQTLRFPAETLKDKFGDCADLAVLYCTVLEAAGVKSAIIKTPNVVLAGYVKTDGSLVPIDLRGFEDLEFVNVTKNGMNEYLKDSASAEIFYPSEKLISDDKRIRPDMFILYPKISTTSANCIVSSGEFSVNYWFKNNGYDTGRRCLVSELYDGPTKYFYNRSCVDMPMGEMRNVHIELANISSGLLLTSKCYLD